MLLLTTRAAAFIFDAKHASNLDIDLVTNYRNFVRPNASTEIFIGFGISHITKLVSQTDLNILILRNVLFEHIVWCVFC